MEGRRARNDRKDLVKVVRSVMDFLSMVEDAAVMAAVVEVLVVVLVVEVEEGLVEEVVDGASFFFISV